MAHPPERQLSAVLSQVLDPGQARRTLHWGRNYLYLASWPLQAEEIPIVVKQFRHEGYRQRLSRRLRGSKAERSWRAARALREAGIPTPEPVLWAESRQPRGPAFYACRHLEGAVEARLVIRALNDGAEAERFPGLRPQAFLEAIAALARDLHAAGFWFRDFSAGNLLFPSLGAQSELRPHLVDLNRVRRPERLSLSRRLRDLCRLPLQRREHQSALLSAYFAGPPPLVARSLYRLFHRSFHGRHRVKQRTRSVLSWLGGLLVSRRAYPHLPSPSPGASRRDRTVWDRLSDQPHQHATRMDKLAVRLADVAAHATAAGIIAARLPRVARRYRRLRRELYRDPVPFRGLGVCVRPWPPQPEAVLRAIAGLGVRHVLLRLHPWQDRHQEEEELAAELHRRGLELTFALPQRRELVQEPARWRRAVAELAEQFTPYGRHFQVGQAINRSKWGVWNLSEYHRLAAIAAEELERYPGVEILGPAVIDFELHHAMAALSWPRSRARFDAMASLLYVDRRGAPENRQLGFDTAAKVTLARAIAETSRWCAPKSWITEVNWPLREGPHAPAGRDVAVDEETAADYLARYYLLALGTGLVERVYWWQLVARGYGLMAPEEDGLRPRPAYHALATLVAQLDGGTFLGPLEAPAGAFLYRFTDRAGEEVVAAWSVAASTTARLPWAPAAAVGRDGERLAVSTSPELTLGPSVRYLHRGTSAPDDGG
jgi:hypothetical protein